MAEEIRSADLMVNSILSDPHRLETLKTDPQSVLRGAAVEAKQVTSAIDSDPWVYRLVVVFLGSTSLAVVLGSIWITLLQTGSGTPKDLPSGLVALGSGAVGALAGLLAPAPKRGG